MEVVICDFCLGRGVIDEPRLGKKTKCKKCNGSGRLIKQVIFKPFNKNKFN